MIGSEGVLSKAFIYWMVLLLATVLAMVIVGRPPTPI
jgi:hypothetical protein